MYNKDKSKPEKDDFTKPCPTMTTLRTELEYMLRGTGHNEIWWLNLIEQQKSYEKPRKVSSNSSKPDKPVFHWVWPYAEKVKNLLIKYLQSDKKLQKLIQAAREDKIYWRGDDFDMFVNIINETELMRKIGIVEYKKQTKEKLKKLGLKKS